MTQIIIGLAGILCFSLLMFHLVDFAFYLRDRYCRFHVGRWDRDNWEKTVEKTAKKWLKRTPTVKISDNARYVLWDILTGRYRSSTIQSWQKAALIMALYESKDENTVNLVHSVCNTFFDNSGMWKQKPLDVDCGMLAYAILTNAENHDRIKPAMDYVLNLILNSVNEDGMVSYTGNKHNPDMYVDAIGLVAPFLAAYAKIYGEQKYEDLAYKQLDMYHTYGLLRGSNLPNHAFDIRTKLPLGVYGWGRGTGWYIIGLLDSYSMFTNKNYSSKVLEWIYEAANEYKQYQQDNGGFGSILQRMNTYDSSATAVMCWFFTECSSLFHNEEYLAVADRAAGKLLKCTRITGAIDWCQGDTRDIGIFAQTYDIMPFAQGMALRAINRKHSRS